MLVTVQALNIIQRARQQDDPGSSGQKIMSPIVDIRLVVFKEPTPEGFTRHLVCLSGRKRQAKGGEISRHIHMHTNSCPTTHARVLQPSQRYFFVFILRFSYQENDLHLRSAGTNSTTHYGIRILVVSIRDRVCVLISTGGLSFVKMSFNLITIW